MKKKYLYFSSICIILFLHNTIHCQKLIGNPIPFEYTFEGLSDGHLHRLSNDGKTVISVDLDKTRTFKWEQDKWVEKQPILNKRWVRFVIANDGNTIMSSFKENINTGFTKLYTYRFKNDKWELIESPNTEINEHTVPIGNGHSIGLSGDGKTAIVINYKPTNVIDDCDVQIFKYENNKWEKSYQTKIRKILFPMVDVDTYGTKLLISGWYGQDFELFTLKNNTWTMIPKSINIQNSEVGHFSLNGDDDKFNLIWMSHLNYSTNAKMSFNQYIIKDNSTSKTRDQMIKWSPLLYSSTDISKSGRCFAMADNANSEYNRVRLFKQVGDEILELNTNLISENKDYAFGVGVHLSEDCNTISLGYRPKNFNIDPLNIGTQILVYDISNLSAISDQKTIKPVYTFPNPSSDFIYFDDDLQFDNVKVFSVDGRLYIDSKSKHRPLDISKLNDGLFIIKFYNDSKLVGLSKFIKR